MKGRGTRLCEDVNKRYFTIFDYSGASALEDAEFDGHPANKQKGTLAKSKPKKKKKDDPPEPPKPVAENLNVVMSRTNRSISFGDGQWMPFDEYAEKSREFILNVSTSNIGQLLSIWIDKKSRKELREELGDHDIYPSAFRHYFELPDTDDADILAKIGFELCRVPTRTERVARFWDEESPWFDSQFGLTLPQPRGGNIQTGSSYVSLAADEPATYDVNDPWKLGFWRTALDHYSLFGIDELEQARTYAAPQFVEQFGSFQSLSSRYGGAQLLKADLETVKQHLYVPMAN